ncbi:MAG: hypothetical protein ACLTXI_01290 [Collinsella sp.]
MKAVKKIVIVLVLHCGPRGHHRLHLETDRLVASFHKIASATQAVMQRYEMTMAGDFYIDKFIEQAAFRATPSSSTSSSATSRRVSSTSPYPRPRSAARRSPPPRPPATRCSPATTICTTHAAIVHTSASGDRHATVSTVDLGLLGMDAESEVDGLKDRLTCLAAVYAPLDGMNDTGVS